MLDFHADIISTTSITDNQPFDKCKVVIIFTLHLAKPYKKYKYIYKKIVIKSKSY